MTPRRNAIGEGTIYQRKDGRWECSVFLETTNGKRKRVSLYGKTRAEAHVKLVAAKAQAHQGIAIPDRVWKTGEYLSYWLNHVVKPHKRAATYAQCECISRLYLVPTFGNVPLAKLTVRDVQAFINEKITSGFSVPSVQVMRKVLSAALTSAMREEHITRNVARLTLLPKYEPEEVQPWNTGEARRFLAAIQGERRYAAFVLLLLYGLRRGELLGLRWSDIDFRASVIRIRQQLQREDGVWQPAPLKTRASKRDLPLLDFARDALLQHHAASDTPTADQTLVFTTSSGRPIEPKKFVDAFHRVCAKNGIRRIRVHDVRHTAATLLKHLGASVRDAQLILGHARVTTTQELYQHDTAEERRASLEKIETALTQKEKNDDREDRRSVERVYCRQVCRQSNFLGTIRTTFLSGAGKETLTPGLFLGKYSKGPLGSRLISVREAQERRRRQWLHGAIAVRTAVKLQRRP